MKASSFVTTLFAILFLSSIMTARASAEELRGRWAVEAGTGFFSDIGFAGGRVRYFLNDELDVHTSVGADMTGVLLGFGSRYYYQLADKTCFFFFACDPRLTVGGTLLRSGGGTISVSEDGMKNSFRETEGYAGSLAVGSYMIFSDDITLSVEVGYRAWIQRPKLSFESGVYREEDERDLREWSENTIQTSFSVGWAF